MDPPRLQGPALLALISMREALHLYIQNKPHIFGRHGFNIRRRPVARSDKIEANSFQSFKAIIAFVLRQLIAKSFKAISQIRFGVMKGLANFI